MCPVCRARFRSSTTCSRCGADLTAVMTLVAAAWRARETSRQSLAAGNFVRSAALATRAGQLHRTPAGRSLESLTAWLDRSTQA